MSLFIVFPSALITKITPLVCVCGGSIVTILNVTLPGIMSLKNGFTETTFQKYSLIAFIIMFSAFGVFSTYYTIVEQFKD